MSLKDLLITVVRKPNGEGHAVLTVRTDKGDFILDNLTDTVKPWEATGYRYLKRQATTKNGTLGVDPRRREPAGRRRSVNETRQGGRAARTFLNRHHARPQGGTACPRSLAPGQFIGIQINLKVG